MKELQEAATIKSKALYDLEQKLKEAKVLTCEASYLARSDTGELTAISLNTLEHVSAAELALKLAITAARDENNRLIVEWGLENWEKVRG